MTTDLPPRTDIEPTGPPASERSWRVKFGEAWSGVKQGVRGQSSFAVHFFFAVLVLAAAAVLGCKLWEWCALIGCIGMVLAAELFNTALEEILHGLDEASKARIRGSLDMAAGAVLLAAATAAVIGGLIFAYRLGASLGLLADR